MKNRLEKKVEKRRRKLIHEMLDLALDINGLKPRQQEETGILPTTFFDFSGHVGWAEVKIHSNGWDRYSYADVELRAHTYRGDNELKDAIQELKAIKADSPAAGSARESR